MFKQAYYTFLAYCFYYIGDIACRIGFFETTANFYQYAMKKSIQYDEKIGFRLWKEVR